VGCGFFLKIATLGAAFDLQLGIVANVYYPEAGSWLWRRSAISKCLQAKAPDPTLYGRTPGIRLRRLGIPERVSPGWGSRIPGSRGDPGIPDPGRVGGTLKKGKKVGFFYIFEISGFSLYI